MNYEFPAKLRNICYALIGIGLLTIIVGFFFDPARVWANILTNNFFFLGMSLAGVFFVALKYATQTAWAVSLKRIPEAMGAYLPIAGIVMLLIFLVGGHSLYHWTHSELYDIDSPKYDEIIANKAAYLNYPFFTIRTVLYFAGWILLAHFIRKNSLREDLASLGDTSFYRKNVTLSAIFLVFFAVTSSTSSWDWIMSIDTHWFSTLFGWYVFSGIFVSGLVMITLITIHLKKQGYLKYINENHFHDLGKYVFAFSIFWAYLWFSQFMLIWYSNIPEEVTYYVQRLEDFKFLFIFTFLINFLIPLLVLMTRDSKRKIQILTYVSFLLILGHWLDVYLMVMPGVIGDRAFVGPVELGIFAGFLGAFLLFTFGALSKASLVPMNDPMLRESLKHHV
jgi:hypothetical protein